MISAFSRALFGASFLVLALLAGGCATGPAVGYMEGNTDDATRYEDFILLPILNTENDPAASVILGDGSIPLLVTKQLLEKRGLRYSRFEEADLLVGLKAAYLEQDRFEFTGNALADAKHTYPGLKSYEVVDGVVADTPSNMGFDTSKWVLILEVYQKDPFELIWSGWCLTSSKRFFQRDENKIQALARILESFPR